jgi:hypothetical protein
MATANEQYDARPHPSTSPPHDDGTSAQSARPPLHPPSPETTKHRQSSHPLITTLNYFTHPVSYTVSGIVRRLSEDEAPTPLARALSANFNGSMDSSDTLSGVFHPPAPKRKLSPFQPPPLTPLTLEGYQESTKGRARLLSKALAEEIRLLIPPRLQLMDMWRLTYSLEQDGSTLSTLYHLCDEHRGKRGGFVLVVRDAGGGIFGAYLTDPPKPQPHYYGSGECFLWRAFRLPALPDLASLPPPPSADTTNLQRMTTIGVSRQPSSNSLHPEGANGTSNGTSNGAETPERIRFKAFPFTGENDFSIFCQPEYLSLGGGNGKYGLWLDSGLGKGVSDSCPTFGNEGLSDEGTKFDVLGVEVWYVGSS